MCYTVYMRIGASLLWEMGGSSLNNSNFSMGGLLVAFVGAVILLAIVNLVQRGRAR